MSTLKLGDEVKVVEEFMSFGEYKNGDVLTIKEFLEGHRIRVEESDLAIIGIDEVEKYQPEEEEEEEEAGYESGDVELWVSGDNISIEGKVEDVYRLSMLLARGTK